MVLLIVLSLSKSSSCNPQVELLIRCGGCCLWKTEWLHGWDEVTLIVMHRGLLFELRCRKEGHLVVLVRVKIWGCNRRLLVYWMLWKDILLLLKTDSWRLLVEHRLYLIYMLERISKLNNSRSTNWMRKKDLGRGLEIHWVYLLYILLHRRFILHNLFLLL
jgi:hypothetical protein